MALSDTKIHQIELLLTLDYLLRFSDPSHPVSQQDICRHANDFGLKYDSKASKGNDVRRQRVKDCLKFLEGVCEKFPDQVPFILETTNSGKYYIEQKNYLNEEQIIQILSAVQNDKYLKDEDSAFLIDRLLDTFSNVYNREQFKNELEKLNKGVRKHKTSTYRKIRLVNKAFSLGKMLKIRYEIVDKNNVDVHVHDFWYRVYKIKEYKNKPYAILIPVYTADIKLYRGFIFDEIDNLNIPKGKDCEVLCDDFEQNRDLDVLFKAKSKWASRYYDSIDSLISANKMPVSGVAFKVGFYFKTALYKFVKSSFEEFFNTKLVCVGCDDFLVNKPKNVNPFKDKNDYLVPKSLNDKNPKYFIVNTFVDPQAFLSWLISDVHGNGSTNISDMVEIVGPDTINARLYEFYSSHAKKYIKKVDEETLKHIDKANERFIK